MERRIIFLDVDGTLTEPAQNEPPESALRAIRDARSLGHLVFLCTGRNYAMLKPLLQYEFDGIIASAGGYIQCGGEVIYDCPMTERQRKLSMEILKKNGIYQTVECLNSTYADENLKDFFDCTQEEYWNSELIRIKKQAEKNLNVLPVREYKNEPVYKILITCHSMQQLEEPMKVLKDDFDFCIQGEDEHGFINGEIINLQFDKGRAVERVCSYLNIPLSASIGFGDSMNDKTMLQTVGLSICMDNGSEALKKFVDDVCPSVRENGILQAFRKYHLLSDTARNTNHKSCHPSKFF